jgi:hypothetical protein
MECALSVVLRAVGFINSRITALSESEPNQIATGSHFPIYRLTNN